MFTDRVDISTFVGKTFRNIRGMNAGSTTVCFDGETDSFVMFHDQNCCESVSLIDVVGDVQDLIGTPIVMAYEESNTDKEEKPLNEYDESYTWTFYRLSTIKGTVSLRWYGSSNGYYSESVDIEKVTQ